MRRRKLPGIPCLVLLVGAAAMRGQVIHTDVEFVAAHSGQVGSVSNPMESVLDYRWGRSWGGGINIHMGKVSLLWEVQSAEPVLSLRDPSLPFAAATVNTTALEMLFQWHPAGIDSVDPYIGGGIALMATSTVQAGDNVTLELDPLGSGGGLSLVAEAGVRFPIHGPVGLLLDAKYFYYRPEAALRVGGLSAGSVELKGDHVLLGVGVSYRF